MKKRFFEAAKRDGLFYMLILISIILFWLPFIPKGLITGWEVKFQYSRILTLIQCLQEGIFPAKLRPMHLMGFGYGVGFFYPDFFLYPVALAACLGMDPELATKLMLFVIITIGTFVSYHLFKRVSSNRIASLFGVILLLGSRINYINLIIGSGYPHLIAYLFIPLAVVGLLTALKDEKRGYIEYAI